MLKRASDSVGLSYGPEKAAPAKAALDLGLYLGILRRRGPLVVAFGLLAGLLGAIYALQLIPVYTASATLLLYPGQSNALTPDTGYNSYIDDGKIESELAIIASSGVARRVAAKLSLESISLTCSTSRWLRR